MTVSGYQRGACDECGQPVFIIGGRAVVHYLRGSEPPERCAGSEQPAEVRAAPGRPFTTHVAPPKVVAPMGPSLTPASVKPSEPTQPISHPQATRAPQPEARIPPVIDAGTIDYERLAADNTCPSLTAAIRRYLNK
jgi:hypothetical protein